MLIHTDLSGPFRRDLRHGASYGVTIVTLVTASRALHQLHGLYALASLLRRRR